MATYDTPIPGVPQYGQAALVAKTAYQNALTRLNQRRQGALRQGGFAGDIDAESGVVKNVRIDGTNQYGGLQLLNRSQAQRDEQARWQGISRGLGSGGGLAAQMRERERFAFGKEDSDLASGMIDSLAGFQDEQNQAAYQRDSALYQAELEAARLAIQNREFNPADFEGVEYPDYGTTPVAPPVAGVPARPGVRPPLKLPGASKNEAMRINNARPPAKGTSSAEQMRINNAVKAAQAASKKKKGGK